ncbi:methyltransferase family protein [Kineothrix alysoides]|uniref:Methyltransferase family protein n=1 Tax=Kineothrix alysoides TaxID=1469948 RepID=A0A4R1R7E5_9FIRM|nr:class I SAM-dependent methyltransferase [Kineothrix alysoides]TCL61242.1 methyltransferase family protein [Kineothrix alysoides]
MFNRIIQNTRKPEGIFGRMILKGMNTGHEKLAAWGLSHLALRTGSHILDVGCGGGANIAKMLKDVPESIVDGLDYSAESIAFSQKTNAAHLGKRCEIHQGDAADLPYPAQTLDYVTAFETIYFWPDLDAAFKEIRRVLKAGGELLICCEADDPLDTTWTDRIEGMTVHRGEDLKEHLLRTGYQKVELYHNEKGWMCLTAVR